MRPWLVMLAACKHAGGDDGGNGAFGALPDPIVHHLEAGDGVANDGPLEPMNTGYWGARTTDIYAARGRWTGALDAGRDQVAPFDLYGSDLGAGIALYRHVSEGVVLHALDAPLDAETLPILMVPDEVRLGMAWQSEYFPDGMLNEQRVVAHADAVLPIGPASVWGIADEEDGSPVRVRWYGEGLGRVELSGTANLTWSAELGFTEMVVPQDPQASSEAAIDPADARPLADPFGHPIAVGGDTLLNLSGMHVDGVTSLYTYTYTPNPSPQCYYYCEGTYAVACMQVGDLAQAYGVEGPPQCPSADGEIISTNGVDPATMHVTPGFLPDGSSANGIVYAWTAAGEPRALVVAGLDGTFRVRRGEVDGPRLIDGVVQHAFWGLRERFDRSVFVGPTSVSESDTDVWLAVLAPDGRVFRLHVSDEAVSDFEPVAVVPGRPAVFTAADDRVVYTIADDGRMFRVGIDQGSGEVHVDALGVVNVPDQLGSYVPVAAVVDPNDGAALVAYMVYPTDGDGDGVADGTPLYVHGVYRAELTHDAVPVRSAPSLLVGYGYADVEGLAVCWPHSDEPFDGSGWTVAGRPALAVDAADDCAVVLPDPNIDPAYTGAENAIDATLPGIGRVTIGFQPATRGPGATIDPIAFPLRDGGFLDATGAIYDAIGLQRSTGWSSGSGNNTRQEHGDVGGDGIWHSSELPYANWVQLIGRERSTACAACREAGDVEGGGVLVAFEANPIGTLDTLLPDGSGAHLPDAQALARVGMARPLLTATGDLCGVEDAQVVCIDDAGTRRVAAAAFSASGDAGRLWPVGDGTYLIAPGADATATTGLWRLDADTLTVTRIDDRWFSSLSHGADGAVYAFASTPTSADAVRIDSTGVQDVARVDAAAGALPGDRLVVLPHQLLVQHAWTWTRWAR